LKFEENTYRVGSTTHNISFSDHPPKGDISPIPSRRRKIKEREKKEEENMPST